MRPRFDISGGTPRNNSILSSIPRWQHANRLKDEYKKTRELREGQKHLWDTNIKAQEFIDTPDDQIAGITEIGVLRSDGNVDGQLNGSVLIGDREHKLQNGRVRIISKQAVDDAVIPILEERQFKDAILSAILSDRSGRICRMMLAKKNYDMLAPNGAIRSISSNVPEDIVRADARPEYFTYYHESSKEWALAVQKLSIVIDNTPIVYDGDILDWLSAYGNVKSTDPRAN